MLSETYPCFCGVNSWIYRHRFLLILLSLETCASTNFSVLLRHLHANLAVDRLCPILISLNSQYWGCVPGFLVCNLIDVISSSLLNCIRCGLLCRYIWTISYTKLLDFLSFSQRNTMIPEMYSRFCVANSWIHRRRVDRVATLRSYFFALGSVILRHSVSSLFFLPIVILGLLSSIPCSEGNLPVHFD